MIYIAYAYKREIAELAKLVADRTDRCRFVPARASSFRNGPETVLSEAVDDASIRTRTPSLLLNAGFAGALSPDLALGEMVFVSSFAGTTPAREPQEKSCLDDDLRRLCVERRLRDTRCLTSQAVVEDRETRDLLRRSTGADIVDMEALFLYEAAERHGIPFLSLKVISDDAGPETRTTAVGQAAKWSRILGATVYDVLERIWT